MLRNDGEVEFEIEAIDLRRPKLNDFRLASFYARTNLDLQPKPNFTPQELELKIQQSALVLLVQLSMKDESISKKYLTALNFYIILNYLGMLVKKSKKVDPAISQNLQVIIDIIEELKDKLRKLSTNINFKDLYNRLHRFCNKYNGFKISELDNPKSVLEMAELIKAINESIEIQTDLKNTLQQIINHVDTVVKIPSTETEKVARFYIQVIVGNYVEFLNDEAKDLLKADYITPDQNFYEAFRIYAANHRNLESIYDSVTILINDHNHSRYSLSLRPFLKRWYLKLIPINYIDQTDLVEAEKAKAAEAVKEKTVRDSVQLEGFPSEKAKPSFLKMFSSKETNKQGHKKSDDKSNCLVM